MKVLVVEDDIGLADRLAAVLKAHQYQVELAGDGEAGLSLVEVFDYDLVLLDLHLPKLDGIHFCQKLRSAGDDVPVLLMTAEDATTSKIAGLDAGADDYVTKPLDTGELLARIRALLRRGRVETSPILRWGSVSLNPSNCEVLCHAQSLSLTGKEYGILELFLRNQHRVFSLDALIERLWSLEKVPSENAVRTHIKSLRRKLKKGGVEDMIETVYGLGYRLCAEPAKAVTPALRKQAVGTQVLGTDTLGAQTLRTETLGTDALGTDALGADALGAPVSGRPVSEGQALEHQVLERQALERQALERQASAVKAEAEAAELDPLKTIWVRHQQKYLDLITHLERVVPVLTVGNGELAAAAVTDRAMTDHTMSDHAVIEHAQQAVHTLKGALGSFGFTASSKISAQIEQLIRLAPPLSPAQGHRLVDLIASLRQSLNPSADEAVSSFSHPALLSEQPSESLSKQSSKPSNKQPSEPLSSEPLSESFTTALSQWLIIDSDQALIEKLIRKASIWGIRPRIATTLVEAQQAIAQQLPSVVTIDPRCAKTLDAGLTFLRSLSQQHPNLPVIVATAQDTLSDRVKVLRSSGGCTFLHKPASAEQILEHVNQSLAGIASATARIIALDDDPKILECLQLLLLPWGFQLTLVSDPVQFWEAVEQTSPDLLILDIEMPELNGIELCQVIRSDPRLNQIPVLFLSAHTDPQTVSQVFEVGADDYVTKPIVGSELVARILNRLDRLRILRKLTETDSLTGLSCRRHAIVVLNRLLALAARQETSLCLAILDLDNFKQVNDCYGHEVGDHVLKTFGDYLRQSFRGADVIARWGGEEFVVGLYSSSQVMAVKRLSDFLAVFNQHIFTIDELVRDGVTKKTQSSFQVSFSAGVATFPTHGEDFQTLYRKADKALYSAKSAGRNQVLPADE